MTITINGTGTITGASTLATTIVSPTMTGAVVSAMGSSVITPGTATASTTGSTIDFLSIPLWVKRITVMFQGVSTSGTTGFGVQGGTSGGVVASGYLGSTSRVGTPTNATISTGFIFNGNLAADVSHGDIVLVNLNSNTWVARGTIGQSNAGQTVTVAGSIALGGVLDRIRITTGNGTDTFDAGNVNILYE